MENEKKKSTSYLLKLMWKDFNNTHPRVSLKSFARSIAEQGNQLAKDWLAHKKGSLNKKKSSEKMKVIAEQKLAKKNARNKKSQKNVPVAK